MEFKGTERKCENCGNKVLIFRDLKVNTEKNEIEVLVICPICLDFRHLFIPLERIKNG